MRMLVLLPSFLAVLSLGPGCLRRGADSLEKPPQGASPEPVRLPAAPDPAPPRKAGRLSSAFHSDRALAETALLALKERDADLLASLRVTEREYREVLFPEFPASKPPRTIPVDFHWFHLDARSRAGIEDALGELGGEDFELIEVVATRGVDQYATFKIHNKVELKVRRKRDGQVAQIKVFGSVVEVDGEFKILGFPT